MEAQNQSDEHQIPEAGKKLSKTDKIVASFVIVAVIVSVIGIGWLLIGMTPGEESKFEGIWMNSSGDVFMFNTDGSGSWGTEEISWYLESSGNMTFLKVSLPDGIVHTFDYWFEEDGNTIVLIDLAAVEEMGISMNDATYHKLGE